MTTFSKTSKFLAVAFAAITLGAGVFAATGPASASDCYDSYRYDYNSHYRHSSYNYSYSYGTHYHHSNYNYGYSYGY